MSGFCSSEGTPKPSPATPCVSASSSPTRCNSSQPQSCRNLKPGDYVRYIGTVTHLDRFATGSIGWGGAVQYTLIKRSTTSESCTGRLVVTGVRATLRVDDNMLQRQRALQQRVRQPARDSLASIRSKQSSTATV